MRVKIDEELVQLLRSGNKSEKKKRACDFVLGLAACNTIVPLVVETEDPRVKLIDYQGESPDEQALAYAAAAYGFVLVERTSGHIIIDVLGQRQRYVPCLIYFFFYLTFFFQVLHYMLHKYRFNINEIFYLIILI